MQWRSLSALPASLKRRRQRQVRLLMFGCALIWIRAEVEPDRKLLTSALQRFFELLDIRRSAFLERILAHSYPLVLRTGVVDFALVVAGLALLSRDAPKEKMLFIFELLDKEGVGALTVDQLFDFITTSSAGACAVQLGSSARFRSLCVRCAPPSDHCGRGRGRAAAGRRVHGAAGH